MAGNDSAVKVKIDHVVKKFNSRNGEVVALNGMDLDVHENEFVCVVGPSGCGKSTILNIIGGLEAPTEGTVLLDGKPVEGPGPDRGIVFQQYALFPWLTVEKNVEFGLKLQGVDKEERAEITHKYLKMVDLEAFAKSYPKELSGGMKQRVAIARALAAHPRVLLMDEPFAALDAMTRGQLYADVQFICSGNGTTVVFVTHNIREAVCLGDRVILFSERPGRICREFSVRLPRPRQINDPKLSALSLEITRALKQRGTIARKRL